MAARALSRPCLAIARQTAWRRSVLASAPAALPTLCAPARRGCAGVAAAKVVKTLEAEIKHEEEQYEAAKEIQRFLKNSEFTLADKDGDVNMCLSREMGEKLVEIEWQLTSPFDPTADMEGGQDEGFGQEATDFCVTVSSKADGSGITFYCSTQSGEDHRFVIGSVKAFNTAEERSNAAAYNGPEFEDLDEKLQEAMDEYLSSIGMTTNVCDFIDASALDKEQREYIRWLHTARKFLAA
eukprot:TRINITY_DN19729_c0_g1_i1.p1 TRINITY_DN19729_c0_g1~~TRINITY_DN19729_c0_g1_i1.p1  ORF type:complete len:264 (-),score=83.19 TRINITY_DN19729_c0_g1_i1:138-854(-)